MMIRRVAAALLLPVLLAACNINTPIDVTPTVEILITNSPTPDVTATPSPTLTPTTTLTQAVIMLSPVQIATQPPVAPESQPTVPPQLPTEGPWVHVIKEGETLGYIMQLQPWGYPFLDQAVIAAIMAINPNFTNPDFLPPPGTELVIPRRTPTPVPAGLELTMSVLPPDIDPCGNNLACAEGTIFDCHIVEEGDTIIGIAEIYNTGLEMLSSLNQNLNWSGCQFNQYSGGTSCNPLISIGQCIMVPLPTPTPVPTGTPSGNETATPTPTFAPAQPVYPPAGAVAPAGIFTLQWVSTGILKTDEFYLVEVQDVTPGITAQPWQQVTRETAITLPGSLIPTDGQTHQFQWRVSVAKKDAGGAFVYIGGTGRWRAFQWQSR